MPASIKIHFASAEYQARFERPYIGLIGLERARAFEAVVTALLPFSLRLADTEIINAGTPDTHKTIFRLPRYRARFEFGAEEYKFVKDETSWGTAQEDAAIFSAAERALLDGSGPKVALCIARVSMHLELQHNRREEILAPFVSEPFKPLMMQRQARSYGHHIRFADGELILDFSMALENGIFLQIASIFNGHPPLLEVQEKMRADQNALFEILGVEEVTNA